MVCAGLQSKETYAYGSCVLNPIEFTLKFPNKWEEGRDFLSQLLSPVNSLYEEDDKWAGLPVSLLFLPKTMSLCRQSKGVTRHFMPLCTHFACLTLFSRSSTVVFLANVKGPLRIPDKWEQRRNSFSFLQIL